VKKHTENPMRLSLWKDGTINFRPSVVSIFYFMKVSSEELGTIFLLGKRYKKTMFPSFFLRLTKFFILFSSTLVP
jgi:hypothetical protein